MSESPADPRLQTSLAVAQTVACTAAEGPGLRFAIWLQGCPFRCPGCCNPEMLPFSGGMSITVAELLEQIQAAVEQSQIEGISLLGGEPFAHAGGASILAQEVQRRGLGVMIYSGYTLAEIHALPTPAAELLAATDVLVDGRYIREQPDDARRWIGSTNQQVHFLTERYAPTDPCWSARDTLEIRWNGRELTINGFPAGHAADLWKRLR